MSAAEEAGAAAQAAPHTTAATALSPRSYRKQGSRIPAPRGSISRPSAKGQQVSSSSSTSAASVSRSGSKTPRGAIPSSSRKPKVPRAPKQSGKTGSKTPRGSRTPRAKPTSSPPPRDRRHKNRSVGAPDFLLEAKRLHDSEGQSAGAKAEERPPPEPEPQPQAAEEPQHATSQDDSAVHTEPQPPPDGVSATGTRAGRAVSAGAALPGRNRSQNFQRVKSLNKSNLDIERQEFQKDMLRVMTEEAAEWVAQRLGRDYGDDLFPRFFDRLQTGVELCDLAEKVSPPDHPMRSKCSRTAQPQSFFARDNISNFIAHCRKLGCREVLMFETEDIVARKNDRQVVNCMLELARIATKWGVQAPLIVQYEIEIEEAMRQEIEGGAGDDETDDEGDGEVKTAPRRLDEDEENVDDEEEEDRFARTRYLPYIPKKYNDIDEALAVAVNDNLLDLRIKRLKKRGEYFIGKPPKVYMRLVRNLLLIRVGGGWEGIVSFCRRKLREEGEEDPLEDTVSKTVWERNLEQYRELDTSAESVKKSVAKAQTWVESNPYKPSNPQ